MHAKKRERAEDALATARNHWFRPGKGAGPTEADIVAVSEIREGVRTDDDLPRGEAVQVAWLVECYMGWPSFEGVVTDAYGEPLQLHAWNVTPDGGILDAAADLHGGETTPFGPDSPRMQNYRREWTWTYNPNHASRHPELQGISWDGEIDMAKLAERDSPAPGMRR